MQIFNSLQQAKRYFSIGLINCFNKQAGYYFWSTNTKKFFKDSTRNYKTFVYENGLIFICNKFDGKVRQVRSDFSISTTLNCCIDNKREFDQSLNGLIVSGDIDLSQVHFMIKGN